ncbi:MAG: NAD(P)-dependent oxidoreductase [Candidatus Obscuribacterales bacterium]|jgi:nucleoside-diphosphate-sugar epimerase|nr:NAD(P)-dependent oxidoreductase [Candidatus Obscuribacterales bacterium]
MKDDLVLVTGSSGLIGSALCKFLDEHGYRELGLDKEGAPYPPKSAEWIFVDITSDESVMNALHVAHDCYGDRIASVCHLAAYYDFAGEPSDLYEKVTIRGTERLLRELNRFFTVEQFIFSSTMLVHAPTKPGEKITEESPLAMKWDYPKSKLLTEELLMAERGDVPVVLMRIAGVYDDWCHSVPISHQIQRIFEHDFTGHLYPGNLEAGQSFVHLQDLINAFGAAIKRRKKLPEKSIFLIGEDKTISYEELQNSIGLLLHGKKWETQLIPKRIAKAGAWLQDKTHIGQSFIKPWMIDLADDHYELDISKARKLLDWEPQHSLKGTLPKMIKNLRENPVHWYEVNKLPVPKWLRQRSA